MDYFTGIVVRGVGGQMIRKLPIGDPTGGAIKTDLPDPGSIHLQGDHTSVKYRGISLAPMVK